MAIPSQPTSTTIVTEAYKLYGISSPSTTEITRAIDYGMEWAKNEIWRVSHSWEPLKTVYYHPISEGLSKYTNPTDFDSHLSLTLLRGDHTGILSATSSTTTIFLAADEDASADDIEGHLIAVITAPSLYQAAAAQCYLYNSSTNTCNMGSGYDSAPTGGLTYIIINYEKNLDEHPIIRRDKTYDWHTKSEPYAYFPISNTTYGEFELYPTPDRVYIIQHRYYANLLRLDLSGTLYSTILRRWQWIFTQGVFVWKLKQSDDSRYQNEYTQFKIMLSELRNKDSGMLDLTNLQATVSD